METHSCMTTDFTAYALSRKSVSQPLVQDFFFVCVCVEELCFTDPEKHRRKF